jgi:WD40 repeat protein
MKNTTLISIVLLTYFSSFSQELLKTKDNLHEGNLTSLCVSNPADIAITGGNDGKTYLWNTLTYEKLKGSLKHNDKLTALAISSDNKFYATAALDFKIRLVDIEQGIPIKILGEHTDEITSLSFNPINNYLASSSKDNSVKIWDNTKNKVSVLTLKGHTKEIIATSFSPDGKLIYSASKDNTIKSWNLKDGGLIRSVNIDGSSITSFSLSLDGSLFACGSDDGKIILWNVNSNTKVAEFNCGKSKISSLSFSADNTFISAGGNNKNVCIFNIETKNLLKKFEAHSNSIIGVSFGNKGDILITAGSEGSIKTWDVSALKIGPAKYFETSEKTELVASNCIVQEENKNGIIEVGEKASLNFQIKNNGKIPALGVIAKIIQNPIVEGINTINEKQIGNIAPNSSLDISIPITIGTEVKSSKGMFSVSFTEANKNLLNSISANFQTGVANSYSYVMVTSQSFASATGKAIIGAPITLKIKIKNITKVAANNVKVNFLLPEYVNAINKLSEIIDKMESGEERDVSIEFYADNNFKLPEIKIGIDFENVAFTNAKDIIPKIKMNDVLPTEIDYSNEVTMQSNTLNESNEQPIFRGGADPMKGLNINKPKEMNIGNYYALIIGIDQYKAPWQKLQNAVNDSKAIEKSIKSSYKFDVLKTLYNEQASRESIIKELEWLVANVKEKDNVFIYYSGHGEYKKDLNKGYWVPADAEANTTAKYISNSDIQTYVNGIKSKHTLLISDACFSGDIFRGNTVSVPFEESEKYYREVNSLVSRQALTSGGIEPVMDGGKDGHSVFAYYLLKTLESNTGKYFDASQLYTKIKIPVINNSEQTPKLAPIKNSGDEGGQFIFIKK